MKKKLYLLLLTMIMIFSVTPSAAAASEEATQSAQTLYELGLFKGTGTNPDGTPIFDLDKAPTRNQAVIMLVRLLGKEEEALAGKWDLPFTDVVEGSTVYPYIGYAYANGLTNGTSATTYSGGNLIRANQYITFVLRALGYTSGVDFQVSTAWEFSDAIGLTEGTYSSSSNFTRGDVAQISAAALSVKQKNTSDVLAKKLINDGVFTSEQYDSATKKEAPKTEESDVWVPRNVREARYSYVRIEGDLHQIVASSTHDLVQHNRIYFEKTNPSEVYLNSQDVEDPFGNLITRALLTHTYKTTTSENPFIYRAIDLHATRNYSTTIKIERQTHYLSATEKYYTYHHSYGGKTLNIPQEVKKNSSTSITTIDEIRYCGKYINVEDYCKFFGLDVTVEVEYDKEMDQYVVNVNY